MASSLENASVPLLALPLYLVDDILARAGYSAAIGVMATCRYALDLLKNEGTWRELIARNYSPATLLPSGVTVRRATGDLARRLERAGLTTSIEVPCIILHARHLHRLTLADYDRETMITFGMYTHMIRAEKIETPLIVWYASYLHGCGGNLLRIVRRHMPWVWRWWCLAPHTDHPHNTCANLFCILAGCFGFDDVFAQIREAFPDYASRLLEKCSTQLVYRTCNNPEVMSRETISFEVGSPLAHGALSTEAAKILQRVPPNMLNVSHIVQVIRIKAELSDKFVANTLHFPDIDEFTRYAVDDPAEYRHMIEPEFYLCMPPGAKFDCRAYAIFKFFSPRYLPTAMMVQRIGSTQIRFCKALLSPIYSNISALDWSKYFCDHNIDVDFLLELIEQVVSDMERRYDLRRSVEFMHLVFSKVQLIEPEVIGRIFARQVVENYTHGNLKRMGVDTLPWKLACALERSAHASSVPPIQLQRRAFGAAFDFFIANNKMELVVYIAEELPDHIWINYDADRGGVIFHLNQGILPRWRAEYILSRWGLSGGPDLIACENHASVYAMLLKLFGDASALEAKTGLRLDDSRIVFSELDLGTVDDTEDNQVDDSDDRLVIRGQVSVFHNDVDNVHVVNGDVIFVHCREL